MRKFELCFQLADDIDHYLVPELLPKDQPGEANEFDLPTTLNFEYHYPTMLPEGIVPRFIVRTYVLSTGEPRWRFGVILNLEENRAFVVGDPIERRVRIAVSGPIAGRRRLLAVIRSDFERIHASYKFQPSEIVPLPRYPDVLLSYQELLVFERSGDPIIKKAVGNRLLEIPVKELLDGVDLDRTRKTTQGRRAFVSYSHRDEMFRSELETHLKLLNRQGTLDLWTDRRITPGSEWAEEIDSNLERADLILLLISSDFIASDYAYGKEMMCALERHRAGSAIVVPVIIRDVDWHSAPFAKLQALPADGKAVASKGRSRLARDAAWTNVAERLRRVLESRAE
jgi:internalin A